MEDSMLRLIHVVVLTTALASGLVNIAPARSVGAIDLSHDSNAPSQPVQVSRQATVMVDVLNVRTGPGYSFDVIAQVTRGDQLIVIGVPGRWLNIRTPDSVEGYVLSDYVAIDSAPDTRGEARGLSPRQSWGQRWWPSPSPRSPIPNPDSDPGTSLVESDEVGNSIRVFNQASGEYVFEAKALLELLRDEGIQSEMVTLLLVNSAFGNRSATSWGRLVVDCNPIYVPVDNTRPSPAGNGKTGAEFCNAVALHEAYHLITLVRAGWGGLEADADAFASKRLAQYTLVRQP
jgi:uncharacterized protein YgiM (DUF1202 family)